MIKMLNACRVFNHKIKNSCLINSGKLNHGFFIEKLIIIISPLLLIAQGNYQFGPSIRVNDDPPGTNFHSVRSSGQHCITCRGDTVYLAWNDERDPVEGIYFSRSTDAGNTWGPNIRIDGSLPGVSCGAAVLRLDAKGWIYATWMGIDDGNRDVYFAKSTNSGLSFSDPFLVNDTTRNTQMMPSIAVDSGGQKIFIAWSDTRNPPIANYDIYFSRSTDGGVSFLPSIRVDDTGLDSSWQREPSIGCTRSGDTVYVAWFDGRNETYDIYFSRSVDGGVSFEPNILVNDTVGTNPSTQWMPSLWADKSGIVYIVWQDYQSSPCQIHFAKSTDGGVSFIQDVKVSDDSGAAAYPSVVVDDSDRIYVAWDDSRNFSSTGFDIYFSFSSDGGNTFNPNVRVNDLEVTEDAWDWDANVTVNNEGKVFVAWDSDRNSIVNWDIYCATGYYVGIEEFISLDPDETLIQIAPNPFKDKLMINSLHSTIDEIEIFDISGRLVKQFDHTIIGLSDYITWDGKDNKNKQLPSGVYFVQLETTDYKATKKVILLK